MYRCVLKRTSSSVIQKSLTRCNRQYSSQLPRQAGFGKILIIIAPLAATGGVVAYAKYDNEFRKTLTQNVPGAEPFLKVVLQEVDPLAGVKQKYKDLSTTVTGFFGGNAEKPDEKPLTKPKKSEVTETKTPYSQKPKPAPKSEQKAAPEQKSTPVKVTPTAVGIIPSDILELEKAIESAAALAVDEYHKAIKVLKAYNEDITKVVDIAIEKIDTTAWASLKNKTGARDNIVENAENAARNALSKIDQCQNALSKSAGNISHEKMEAIRDKIKTLTDHINGVKNELYKTKDASALSEKYWKNVESARNYFIDEIEAIFPGVDLTAKKLNLSKDDLDLFITHAYSHVLAYQKELQRLQLDGEMRLKRAIEALRGDDQTESVKAQLEFYVEKERRNLALENQKKISKIKADSEKELRQQLKRQTEAHVDHINDALSQKETELRRTFTRELDEKITTEKAAYKLQLASMLGKLKGMEAALKARAESEKCAHQAQSLWAACQALWASVRAGEPGVHWQQKLRPLINEIKAVSKAAAEGDELVAVVLQNLPHEALNRGVYPEDALRERFLNVERVARKVALVPAEGASLPVYLLSYIQSFLIMRPDNPISNDELQDKPIDFSKLDTYDILNRARYFLDRGDLTQSLKYMNLLQGAPRKVARDWLKEARLLLETQQAANTLMAHAAASGLLYL